MREIRFRAWMKHTKDNRWSWAYDMADKKETNIRRNGFDVLREEEWRDEFLEQWDKEHKPEERYTVRTLMAMNDECSIILNGKNSVVYGYEILDIMQFTGLKDKAGKEIYEGDVVVFRGSGHPKQVWYDGAGFHPFKDKTFHSLKPGVWEIIGNVHESPELLEGGAR